MAAALLLLTGPAPAQMPDGMSGGDLLITSSPSRAIQAARDVLAAGDAIALDGTVAQDAHIAAFGIEMDASTGGDLYAIGFSVTLRAAVGGDVTAMGMTLRIAREAEIDGNARLAGGSVTVDGPVRGALAAVGGEVTLNSEVSGDVRLAGGEIDFGPEARIGGTLTYSAPDALRIPAHVIPAERVIHDPGGGGAMMRRARDVWADWEYPVLPTFLTMLAGLLILLGFFFVIGAVFLAFAPKQVRALRQSISARPGMSLLAGVVGLSFLFGLVPISVMTVVGALFVPILMLAALTIWTLGYILGAYVVAMWALRGLGADQRPGTGLRLVALGAGIALAAVLNFVPVLGWVINFALVLLGIGGMTRTLLERVIDRVGPALDADLQPLDPQHT